MKLKIIFTSFAKFFICMYSALAKNETFYVVEPFDAISDEVFSLVFNDQGDMNLALDEENKLFGKGALRVNYEVTQTENWGGFNSLGWTLNKTAHNCYGATYMSFWYKILEKQSLPESVHLRLILLDDSNCIENCNEGENLETYYSFHYILDDNSSEWNEIRIYLRGDSEFDSPFWRTGWVGTVGNDVLDIERIRGWRFELSINSQGGVGTKSKGSFLIDQLSCVGSGALFGASFHQKLRFSNVDLLTQTLEDGSFYYINYDSDLKSTKSELTSDGLLFVNYTIEHSNNWGGFISYQHSAPGNAYYNLSQNSLISFDHDILLAASPVGRSHLRFILLDGSHCEKDCDVYPGVDLENFYSFDHVLDDQNSFGKLSTLLQGDTNSSSPFYNPGWVGALGNGKLDPAHIKGYKFELNIDSQGEMGSTVNGIITISNLEASNIEELGIETISLPNIIKNEIECISEPEIQLDVGKTKYSEFRRVEFLASKCCETCQLDPSCLFAFYTEKDCFMTSFLSPYSISLSNENRISSQHVFWVDDSNKRGKFCTRCKCSKEQKMIDCRGANLLLLPKEFTESWEPEILDLRENPNLGMIGTIAFEDIRSSLKEIRLPINMRYVSHNALSSLPNLARITFENEASNQLINAITNPVKGIFGDICCKRGKHLSTNLPSSGLSFCLMEPFTPGIDSIKMPFVEHLNAEAFSILKPSSSFMSEAADSPEKCAEYCTIAEDCSYFSFDARFKESEHKCFLQTTNGTRQDFICCDPDDYADEAQKIPGWTSGRPPRTRNIVDNARVLVSIHDLDLNSTNTFITSYQLSLGTTPLRGAVWIEPTIVSQNNYDITVTPSQIVLYDNITKPTVTIQILDPSSIERTDTIVIYNRVESCDTAFTISKTTSISSSETTVFIHVAPISTVSYSVIIVPIVISSMFVVAYLYVARQRRIADKVWEIKLKDLQFDDPPEIIGRGTFGLVLLAEYRGTQVAVKRVIPPRIIKKNADNYLFGKGASDSLTLSYSNTTPRNSFYFLESGNTGFTSMSMSEKFNIKDPHSNLSTIFPTENFQTEVSKGQIDRSRAGLSSGFSLEVLKQAILETSQPLASSKRLNFSKQESSRRFSSSSNDIKKKSLFQSVAKVNGDEYSVLKADFIREMRYLSKLRHPCITTVMGAVIDKKEEPMLVMEYMDHGSLYDLLHNQTLTIEGEHILPILRDITHGMRFLHCASPQVIHGDLKAANILIESKFRAKVADFGLSQKKQVGATGTAFWMAPELLRGESTNTAASDVYSFGIILYEVYSRLEPYDGEDFMTVINGIIDGKKRPPIPSSCPTEIKDLMKQCVHGNPGMRPTYEQMDKKLRGLEISSVEPKHIKLSSQEKQEKELTDSLLNEVFPKHVAEALRAGRKVEPESREIVTIFFSDIVGFTKISSSLSPIKISQMLDRLYAEFDALSRYYDIFKVETIGDAYMAVTNLIKDQPDHAKRIAEFSLSAVKVANSTLIDLDKPDLGYVNIRVGFHSGPVVANVIGSRNPRYCLFGDTVNTASRMESNSEKNRIHCSERAAKFLLHQAPDISIYSRGKIQVKGKGEMETFWVHEHSPCLDNYCFEEKCVIIK